MFIYHIRCAGTFAVVSIMVGKTVMKYESSSLTIHTLDNSTGTTLDTQPWVVDQPSYSPVQVVTTVSLVVGCIQVSYGTLAHSLMI